MKVLFNTSVFYLVLGAVAALALRGFAAQPCVAGASALGAVHPHLIALGFFGFLVATLFALRADFTGERLFRPFYLVYNVGIVLSAGALLAKGAALYTNTAGSLDGVRGRGHPGQRARRRRPGVAPGAAEQGGRPRDAADAPSLAPAKFPLSTEWKTGDTCHMAHGTGTRGRGTRATRRHRLWQSRQEFVRKTRG